MGSTLIGRALIVGAGGFVGSALRFLVSGWVYRSISFPRFPWGTLAVNVLGCLLLGWLGGLTDARHLFRPETRLFLMVGLLGGFTTFSTFGYETLTLLTERETLRAVVYVASQLALGIGAAWVGFALGRMS